MSGPLAGRSIELTDDGNGYGAGFVELQPGPWETWNLERVDLRGTDQASAVVCYPTTSDVVAETSAAQYDSAPATVTVRPGQTVTVFIQAGTIGARHQVTLIGSR